MKTFKCKSLPTAKRTSGALSRGLGRQIGEFANKGVIELAAEYSKCRVALLGGISSLKDTVNKKQDPIQATEDLSTVFFTLALLFSSSENEKGIGESILRIDQKLNSAPCSYATAARRKSGQTQESLLQVKTWFQYEKRSSRSHRSTIPPI